MQCAAHGLGSSQSSAWLLHARWRTGCLSHGRRERLCSCSSGRSASRVLSLTAPACMSRQHSHSHSSAVRMAAPVAASAMAAPHTMQQPAPQPQPPLGPAAAPQTPLSRTQLIQVRLAAGSKSALSQPNATPSSTVIPQLNAADVAAVTARVAARLPTAAWAHLLPEAEGGSIQVAELDMRHGTLSPIQVRVIHMSSNDDQSSASGALKNDEAAALDQSLGWMLQSLRVDGPAGRPLVGLAYKSSEADKTKHRLQLSTVDRCVLISFPSSAASELQPSAPGAVASSQPAPRTPLLAFTDTLRQVLARDDVVKVCVGVGETMWSKLTAQLQGELSGCCRCLFFSFLATLSRSSAFLRPHASCAQIFGAAGVWS